MIEGLATFKNSQYSDEDSAWCIVYRRSDQQAHMAITITLLLYTPEWDAKMANMARLNNLNKSVSLEEEQRCTLERFRAYSFDP